jgi:hypothetical protein
MSNHPTTQPARATPGLPEQRTWRRYSSHHELPFSLTSSAFLHLIGLLTLALLGVLVSTTRHSPPLQVGIAVPGDEPEASGGVPNPGDEPQAKEAIAQPGASAPARSPLPPTLNEPQKPRLPLPPIDPKGTRPVDADKSAIEKQAGDIHGKVHDIIGRLTPAPNRPPGPGGTGPGGGTVKRQARWTLVFNTHAGQDYLHQLRDLNAILAVPLPDGRHLVFRDLGKQPVPGKIEDISPITLIRWHDTKPESVQSLARALGLAETPPEIVALFPTELEQELLAKETQYSSGKSEDEIEETIFTVTRLRDRPGYEAKVTAQRLKQKR